ncbi:MAG TPA: hypothetical protein VFJ13_11615 [Paracoccaceae bacterium]|nr:hypothetical protein [Paracoccaceae bacterium]
MRLPCSFPGEHCTDYRPIGRFHGYPDLVIADEPAAALGAKSRRRSWHPPAELQREFEMGMILITHDFGVVARHLCDPEITKKQPDRRTEQGQPA